MAGYCGHSAVYEFGVPRGGISNAGRLSPSASASTDAITLDQHGFEAGDALTLRADVDAGGSLPAPLAEGTTYYALPVTDSAFKVSATPGGAAIDLTSAGVRVVVIAPSPIDAAIEWGARIIDNELPAHVVPLTAPYPPIIEMTNAELAAGKLGARVGSEGKTLADIVEAATKRIERWGKGVPIRGENSPERSGLAASAGTGASRSCNDWRRHGGL